MTTRKFLSCFPVLVACALPACSGGNSDGGSPLGAAGSSVAGSSSAAGTGSALGGASGSGTTSPGGVTSVGGSGVTQGGSLSSAGTSAGGDTTLGGSGAGGAGGAAGSSSGGSGGASGGATGGSGGSGVGGGTADPAFKVVMYLPNWNGSFASWAGKIDFSKMTHLDLAFGTIKSGTNDWDLGAPDDDVKSIAKTAHDAHVKIMVSIGGADDDIGIINRYATADNIDPMVNNLDALCTRLNLDGVDVDLERGSGLKVSTNFPMFLSKLIAKLRPQGRVVSTALAQYIIEDTGDDATKTQAWLSSYDFINLMIYNKNMDTYTKEATWWTTQRHIDKGKLTWGVDYTGGTGADAVKALTTASKAYGGVMAWELSSKGALALWKDTQDSL